MATTAGTPARTSVVAFFGGLVKSAVADEVEDMILTASQTPLEVGERRVLHPIDADAAVLDERANGLPEHGLLALDIQPRIARVQRT
jgi:hypothetical protein